jgi:structural maintenance of chromosomes protein 5
MKRYFPEIAAGWEWIQEHQSDFDKEVFGPPMITCSLKDERYSDQIQALLQQSDFGCFTAQTPADHKKLSHQLYKMMSLSVDIRTCVKPLESFEPPTTREDAARMGLDGFAIDFLDGPEPVLAMLCADKGLHRSGVALAEHTDAQYESLVQSGTISQWSAGKQSYVVRRRKEYGPQAMTTVAKHIQPGKYWTSQPVDTQEKAALERRLREVSEQFEAMKAEHNDLMAKKDSISDQQKEVEEKVVSVDA